MKYKVNDNGKTNKFPANHRIVYHLPVITRQNLFKIPSTLLKLENLALRLVPISIKP